MKYLWHKVYILFTLAACTFLFVGMLILPEQENQEKRELALLPRPIINETINLNFPNEAESYLNEHFAMRSAITTINASLYNYAFNESTSEKVIVGKDNMFFFSETLDDYFGINILMDEQINRITRVLQLMEESAMEDDVPFYIAIAPNKASLYGDYMPMRYRKVSDQRNVLRLGKSAENVGLHWVDLDSELKKHKKDTMLYYYRDSHWNSIGAGYAAAALLREMDMEQEALQLVSLPISKEGDWEGDLATMLLPTRHLKEEDYSIEGLPAYSYIKNVRRMDEMEIRTSSNYNEESLLVYRDSFGNALIPILSGYFGEIKYTRAQPYPHYEANDYDAVVLEIAERNIPRLLDRAPMMEAPLREFSGEVEILDSKDSRVFCEEGLYFYHIYGEIDRSLLKDDDIVVWAKIEDEWRECFPILESAIRKEENEDSPAGFSFYTEIEPEKSVKLLVFCGIEKFQLELDLEWIEEADS